MTYSFWEHFLTKGSKNLIEFNRKNNTNVKLLRGKTMKHTDLENLGSTVLAIQLGWDYHDKSGGSHDSAYATPCNGLPNTAKCLNGGAPNSKNCKICLCPLGYGGVLCGQRKAGCGAALVAASSWKGRNFTVARNTTTPTAPAGKKIQIRVMNMTNVQCLNGCTVNAIEPKLMANKAITNRR
nr:CBN-NAS-31 protein [Haemonchus contortus]